MRPMAPKSPAGADSRAETPGQDPFAVEIHHRIADIGREAWDTLVDGGSPFLEWDWLHALEESGCATRETGWAPHHVVVRLEGRIVAACPLYLKGHSQGEFVFDHQWAHAAQQAGIEYYPKLLVAVPFTPATGCRILTAPGADRPQLIRLVGGVLMKLCVENGISSVHVNFCLPDEIEALGDAGYHRRSGIQYQWENHGYETFEDYLGMFRSKRRNKIRREIREMADQGIDIRVVAGDDIDNGLVPTLYRLYKNHIEKLYWGNLYLNEAFFEHLVQHFKRNLCFVLASREGRVIAGTFNVQKNGVFYGRYWGTFEEWRYLHFNVCYYSAIDHCIRNGIQRFEPGAGGDFKQLRGFEPRITDSMHFLHPPVLHEAIGGYLRNEREHISRTAEWYQANSQLKLDRK